MKYDYQARTGTGEVQQGIVEASTKEAALQVLRARGFYVTALEEALVPLYAKKIALFERVTSKDVMMFSRQLAIMFKSRVPLIESFKTIALQSEKVDFREKILKISEEVEGGSPLSQALAIFPQHFSSFYINMVMAGEASGKLSEVFTYLADYLERDYHFKGRVKNALMYPALVVLVFFAVAGIIINYVIPQIVQVVRETSQNPPYLTRVLLAFSDFIKAEGFMIIFSLVLLVIFIFLFSKTSKGKEFFDKLFLKTPLLNTFLKKVYLGRIALNLSTLISGGLPIVKALEITSEVVGSAVYRDIINKIKDEVKKGQQMSAVLENYPIEISPLFYQMVAVGEKTGTLDSSLINISDFYQKELDKSLDDFAKLLEPILIIVLGVFVGFLFAAVLIPIYQVASGY